ncbi:hypothetical protein NMG60_11012645 [Bertholletia excelsa]
MEVVLVAPPREPWGTWEELVLGGAVLRHGTQAWDTVASELRARTICPYTFTPEACKAKYEDLQERYSGCTAWFEELRKRRVAELRRELEKSEDSIGSLQSKLESLKAEKGDCGNGNYGSSRTDSPVPVLKSEGFESSSKDISKDGLSAGSFTEDIRTNLSPSSQNPASIVETDTKPEIFESSEHEKTSSIDKLDTSNEQGETPRRRRGKRKRKDCKQESKEWSIGESENLGSTKVTASCCKENSTSTSDQPIVCISTHDRIGNHDLMGIFNSVAANENALVFRRRLDSQKRARYKKIIRRHMDFDTIRARITSYSIKSVKELFRDLLLLANNALVFYSRRTREYKTAMLLRDLVTKAYRQHCRDSIIRSSAPTFPLSSMCNPPVKPRSFRPRKRRLPVKLLSIKNFISGTSEGCKKLSNDENLRTGTPESGKMPSCVDNVIPGTCRKTSSVDSGPSLESLPTTKKGSSLAGRGGRGTSNRRPKAPRKERKRVQRR